MIDFIFFEPYIIMFISWLFWKQIDMGEIRTPTATKKRIDEIRRITDTKLALESIVELFETYTREEEKVPARYDEKTGEPAAYKWEPSKSGSRFTEIYLGGINLSDPEPTEPGLAQKVVKEIKETGSLMVDTPFGTYVFAYEEQNASSPEHGGGTYYAIRHFISVKKIKKI